MPGAATNTIGLLLVGAAGSEFRLAAVMAADAGAEVVAVDTIAAAMMVMRSGGADLAMIDVEADVANFITTLRRERMALPVYACGVDAPAWQAVAAIRAGARDYLPLPPDRELIAAAIVSVGRNNAALVGEDPALGRAVTLGLALAPARTPFMITGEPGSGRELLARTIHAASGRPGRFVCIDCLGTAADMIDSELFGHAAGTFPGAVADRRGRFEAAQDGTLFIDEVTFLPAGTQSRLAQFLVDQARQGRSGGRRPARVIASTAGDIEARVGDGQFRAALLAQLGLVRLAVPPLRDRGGDVARLARHFGNRFAIENDLPVRPFADDAMALLCGHDWPGNVAELEDVVHRAVLISTDKRIAASAIMLADGGKLGRRGKESGAPRAAIAAPGRVDGLVGSTVVDVERALILETLKACSGNRTSASTILGISVRTMRNKLKTFIEAGLPVFPIS
jgi:DNA-binding NtrC family response regulator